MQNISPPEDFLNQPLQTDKTDETYNVTNEQFLEVVFGSSEQEAQPILVSFTENPNTCKNKRIWEGTDRRKSLALPYLHPENNNYFSLAAFSPDDTGNYRRQKKQFSALHAVMLDDVGTKVPIDRITLPPSWRIETSSGNFQVGFILAQPLKDGALADRFMKTIITAGLCDPGASGPMARLARLPVAVNGKYEPSFRCRLVEWDPAKRYTVDEMVEGLQLEIPNPASNKNQDNQSNDVDVQDENTVTIPRPTENAVIAALRERNLYKMPLGSGKHDITCPWISNHTGAVDNGTVYFEPSESWPIGGFKCQHGHCNERRIKELLQFLEIKPRAARMKPTIFVVPGEIHRVVNAAEEQLALTGRYYQRGGLITTIVTDPDTQITRIQESNSSSLVYALAGAADWQKYDGRNKSMVTIDPPGRHIGVLHDSPTYAYLPVLSGLARQPYLRNDDSLVMASGYDSASGMYGVFADKDFKVPDAPSKKEAQNALDMLKDLLSEFSFPSKIDLSAALSAILTAAVRPRLPHAPMFHVRAHQVGSGKSYLCQLITIFATPQNRTPGTFPKEDEECRKMLLAELLRGPAVIEFDNLTTDLLAHKSLCIALTTEHMTDRILGVSKTATVSTRVLFLSSGNNVGPVQDMTRRCITINIDPACETPATRTFKRPKLLQDVKQQRGAFESAALTVIRAWIAAGRPRTECPSLAGFEEWSDFCRQPLLWLGYEDPVKSVLEALADDPEREMLGRLLDLWYFNFQNKPTMVRQAVTHSNFSDEMMQLKEVFQDIAGERGDINNRVLGRWIKRHSGRIVNGLRFMRASGNRSAEAWYVDKIG